MKTAYHLTPRYIKNRIASLWYEKTCPEHPWLTRNANEILASYLKNSDIGLEFGSGRSTLWLAQRVAKLTSVEHADSWAKQVRKMLSHAAIENVDYRHLACTPDNCSPIDSAYVKVIDELDNDSLDFCLIDGEYRDYCALKTIEKIRPGGVLIVDNVNWFLPSKSISPNSRSLSAGPKGAVWGEVAELIQDWRRIWTSSGVTDTAFFIKPCCQPRR